MGRVFESRREGAHDIGRVRCKGLAEGATFVRWPGKSEGGHCGVEYAER